MTSIGFTEFDDSSVSGWYNVGKPKPNVEMTFEFFSLIKGVVGGKGSDTVGGFTFNGTYKDNCDVTFIKSYTGKHTVTYSGKLAKENGEFVINGDYKINKGKNSTGTFSLLLVGNKARAQKEIDSVMTKAEITFVDFKADIQPAAQEVVNGIASIISKYPMICVKVEGHTMCSNGKGCEGECVNAQLAGARIANVVTAMQRAGCKNNFESKGWGCKHPEVKAKKLVRISTF